MAPNRRFHVLAVVGLAALAACAEERPPINRVQPDALPKSFFVGEAYHDPSDDPEFWSQATLVDVGYGASQDGLFTSTYAQPLTRIKWVVQENLLVGRLTYERIADSDGKGAGAASDDGVVVAVYPIVSHFDIQRDYNPATGEQLNTIGENTTDRPWYDRDYIRVDWSRNLSTDNYEFDTLSQLGVYGGVTYEPLAYYVNDPYSLDAPHFDLAGGYFDVTNKAFATPQMVDLSHFGWGIDKFPACWLDADFSGGQAPSGSCSPVELTIRQAFRRVVDNDYEPQDWDGHRFQAFGAFTTDRYGYARNYGMTDTKWHRFINRYNIWDRSHAYQDPASMAGPVECFTPATTPAGSDPHRDTDGDGTEDECAAVGRGSRCDTFKQRCTLPYRDRVAVTQPWYYTTESNPEFFAPTQDATHEWDVALRSAVMTARYAECQRVGDEDCSRYPIYTGQQDDNQDAIALAREVDDCRNGKAYQGQDCQALADTLGSQRGYSAGVIALAKMDEMVVLCHSPVEANDHDACGGPRLPAGLTAAQCDEARLARDTATLSQCGQALEARKGDLRFHQVNVIRAPQTPSPWGIMVDAHDPLTGEKVSASINVWSHVNDLWSQGVVDTARYITGELRTEDVTEGTFVRDWASAARATTEKGAVAPMSKDEVDTRLGAFGGLELDEYRALKQSPEIRDPQLKKQFRKLNQDLRSVKADARAASTTRATYDARRKRAIGSDMEAELTTRMMQELAGVDGFPDAETVLQYASPLRGANPMVQRDLQNLRELALADRGACVRHEAPAPIATADLAQILQDKFGAFSRDDDKVVQLDRAAKMQKYLAYKAHYAVVTHEMGHSIALRHNFVSSSDAYLYRPQYWQLRTNDGETGVVCTDFTANGNCVGPRYFDPVTENERKNLIWMFMQSSTMDYAGEGTQDLLGLGVYDFAAARMFYGEAVAVHADPSFAVGTHRGTGMLMKLDNFGGILGLTPQIGQDDEDEPVTDYHYSEMQNRLQLIQDCTDVEAAAFEPASWDEARLGAWHPLVDGLIVSVNGQTTKCRQQPVDYAAWEALRSTTEAEGAAAGHAVDSAGRTRVPYGFATDSWADVGNLAVYRHDNGADPYELFDFLIAQQEVGHIFDNYRRNRQSFSVRNASGRTLTRYNEKLRDAAKGLGLMANVYRDFTLSLGYDFDTFWPAIAPLFFPDNILASGIAFDHFSRQLQRPEAGPHFQVRPSRFLPPEPVMRSASDPSGIEGGTVVVVPNGATGYFGNVGYGGRPVENALADDKGEYDSQFTVNAGSYYDKLYTAMLMTESVDNFISDSRRDFVDARYRAVSIADLFPDGYRRWLATNLTGDDEMKGARIAMDARNLPLTDGEQYPAFGIGWTSWWRPEGVTSCFPTEGSLLCADDPANTGVLDPQVGWEQQKFLIAWTLMYLPENQQQKWLDMLHLWELGADSDPAFQNRIELHAPNGRVYVAKTFGKEVVLGKVVQRGIAARVLEYANEQLVKAYEVTDGPDLDADGTPDWYVPVLADGQPIVKFDSTVAAITPEGGVSGSGRDGCNVNDNSECTCSANRACVALEQYTEVPFFLRQAISAYGLAHPSMKGVY